MLFFYCILGFIVLLFVLDSYFKYNRNARLLRKVPGPDESFLVGNALGILLTPVELFGKGREYAKTYNNLYRWYSFLLHFVNIYNPDDIEIVMSTSKHSEKSIIYRLLRSWLREGLILSGGAKWLTRRKILTPTFHFTILQQSFKTLEENGQRLIDVLEKRKGKAVNVVPVLSEYTLSSICETAMGTRLHKETSKAAKSYKKSIHELGNTLVERFTKLPYLSDTIFYMSKSGRTFRKHLGIVHSFTRRVIKERKAYLDKYGIDVNENTLKNDDIYLTNKNKRIAMLDLLLTAERDGIIDMRGVEEEVDTFMFEIINNLNMYSRTPASTYNKLLSVFKGHDTTATGLQYFFMLIANHRNIQDKLFEELREIFEDTDRPATMNDLNKMRYLDCCLKESLRLYPPVPFISRKLTETTKLSNYTIPEGTTVHIHIYDLHRREDLFTNADKFDPDRFLPENCVGRHLYAYIPFSVGPRNCIGQKFAMLEMKSCAAAILRNFELEPVTRPQDLEFRADLVLRNTGPIYVKFVKRR